MANEAVCIEAPRIIKRYTIPDATAVAKGTLMKLSGGSINTVGVTSSAVDVFAGIAVEEKVASDGITEIGVAIDGVWDIYTGVAASATGFLCAISGANSVRNAVASDILSGCVVGRHMEVGTAAILNRVRLGS